jgi:hypothetical protein
MLLLPLVTLVVSLHGQPPFPLFAANALGFDQLGIGCFRCFFFVIFFFPHRKKKLKPRNCSKKKKNLGTWMGPGNTRFL